MQETENYVDKSKSKPSSNNRSTKPIRFNFLSIYKNFDLYTKIDEDFKVKTNGGAFLSIFGWIIILFLVLGEFSAYRTPKIHEHMLVDTSLGQQLKINVDITFHALTCADVHLDAMDVAGDNQLNVEHDMLKERISPDGKSLGKPMTETINTVTI